MCGNLLPNNVLPKPKQWQEANLTIDGLYRRSTNCNKTISRLTCKYSLYLETISRQNNHFFGKTLTHEKSISIKHSP